jgi:hypothetical protein
MMKAKENHRQIMKAERMVKSDRDLNQGAVMTCEEAERVVESMNQFMSPNPPASMADVHLPKAQYISPGIGIESYAGSRPHDMGHKGRMRHGYGDRMDVDYSGSGAVKIKSATLGR